MRAAAFALIAATASTVAARNDAHVYLHPAEPVPAVTTRPEVVAQALSYHLDLPQTDPSVGPREAWAFSPPASPKSMLEDNRNRLVLYIDGVDEPQELIDSQTILRPTHQVSNSPSSDSWSALLASFAESAATMAGGAENAMSLWGSTLLAEAHDVASAVQLWLSPDSERDLDWMDVAASHDSGALVKLQREVGHINEHLDNLASAEAAQSEFQALRLQALSDIKQAHGVTGEEYKQALHLVKATIHSAVERMHQVAKNRGQEARIALILSSNNPQAHESLYQKRNSASIGSLLLPFGKRVTNAAEQRAFKFGEVASSLGAPSFEGPSFSPQSVDATLLNPKDYQGKCFTSAEALYNATASCSGHGTAVQKIRATKRCFRCQCKATRTSNSKTSWAGDACEKVDLSNQTLLFLGTAAGLIFLTAATIQFMLKEGDLPLSGTLASVSVPTYKL